MLLVMVTVTLPEHESSNEPLLRLRAEVQGTPRSHVKTPVTSTDAT